jgi:hypothetical protein
MRRYGRTSCGVLAMHATNLPSRLANPPVNVHEFSGEDDVSGRLEGAAGRLLHHRRAPSASFTKAEETMRKLSAFNNVSLDGYFTDANGDMSWAHNNDPEWNAFAAENASGGGTLLMGRITYELMASFWPTPQAMQSMPAVATACRRSWSPERSTRRRGATRRS